LFRFCREHTYFSRVTIQESDAVEHVSRIATEAQMQHSTSDHATVEPLDQCACCTRKSGTLTPPRLRNCAVACATAVAFLGNSEIVRTLAPVSRRSRILHRRTFTIYITRRDRNHIDKAHATPFSTREIRSVNTISASQDHTLPQATKAHPDITATAEIEDSQC
jgi:hypothetical protein